MEGPGDGGTGGIACGAPAAGRNLPGETAAPAAGVWLYGS
jgi:hypothetical protein